MTLYVTRTVSIVVDDNVSSAHKTNTRVAQCSYLGLNLFRTHIHNILFATFSPISSTLQSSTDMNYVSIKKYNIHQRP